MDCPQRSADSELIGDGLHKDTQFKEDLLCLLERSPYLRWPEQDPEMWHRAIFGDDGRIYAATFLLTLLPNVEALSLPACWYYLHDPKFPHVHSIRHVLNIITQRANDDEDKTASLARLTKFRPAPNERFTNYSHMQDMAPFLAIKSVRNFYGDDLAANKEFHNHPFRSVCPTFGLGLEHVELSGCNFGSSEFSDFIKPMSRLKTFRFSHRGIFLDDRDGCAAGAVIAALMAATGQTLEFLTVYSIHDDETIRSKRSTRVTDMTGFKRLKKLTLGTSWLLGPSHRRFANGHGYQSPPCDPAVPSLVDLLPPSITRLRLLTRTMTKSMECLQILFKDYIAEKAVRLLALAAVEVCGFRGRSDGEERISWPEAILLAQNVTGAKLIDEGVSDNIVTELERDFEERFRVSSD